MYKSPFGFAIITASRFAASAVLNNAPIFPGFSNDSPTKIKGFLDNFKSDKGTQEYFTELFNADKETVNKLNPIFEEVYNKKIQTPEDLARAYGIAKVPKEEITFEGDLELNDKDNKLKNIYSYIYTYTCLL